MDPRALAKRYGRTAVCIINGVFNTDWDEYAAAHGNGPDVYHKVGAKTNFGQAHLEDSIAFTIIKYKNGILYRAPRTVQGRGFDNSPNIPTSSIVNGLEGGSSDEIMDQIQVTGLHLGEGALQAGGSGRTYNWGRQEFSPGQLIGTAVCDINYPFSDGQEGKDNVHLMPIPLNPKTIRTSLLDRGRTLSALNNIGQNAIPVTGANTFGPRPVPLNADGKEIVRVILRLVSVEKATIDVDDLFMLDDIRAGTALIDKYISAPSADAVNVVVLDLVGRLNRRLAALLTAYTDEAGGVTSKKGMAIIEPLEQYVMDQIDRKNNVLRNVLGVCVAPVSSDTYMIPLNMCPNSR